MYKEIFLFIKNGFGIVLNAFFFVYADSNFSFLAYLFGDLYQETSNIEHSLN